MSKDEIKEVCFMTDFLRSQFVYKIIDSGMLDKQIPHIQTGKVKTSMYNSFKDGIASCGELFVLNLDKFLMYLDFNFIIPNAEKFAVLNSIFKSKYTQFLVSTKDVNSERTWYILQYKKTFIDKFVSNMRYIKAFNIKGINDILNERLDLDKMSLRSKKDIDEIFDFLKDLINCSRNNVQFLFYDPRIIVNSEVILDTLCEIFDNYKKRKKYLRLLGL